MAGQAWRDCRAGRRDAGQIGIYAAGLTGMWEIQGNVVRDLANLNRVETLPFDSWGLIPVHYDQLPPEDVELLDRVAAVSEDGGPAPSSVFNQPASGYVGVRITQAGGRKDGCASVSLWSPCSRWPRPDL